MPSRGFQWGVYETDGGQLFALRVDADYFEDLSREWQSAEGFGLVPLPRGWRPRHVFGVDDVGRLAKCVVARTTNALWTGDLTVFQFYASDETIHFVDVIGRTSERTVPRPP